MAAALLLDLDETLMIEEPAAAASFLAAARWAAEQVSVDAGRLGTDARASARELWRRGPQHAWCRRIGISSWEGLWCRYEGAGPELAALRAFAPGYRRDAWAAALAAQGVDDLALAGALGARFVAERRARHACFADAAQALDVLGATHALALVTNGAACLQREKLAASGLADRFAVVVVSADVGVAKPDPAPFHRALDALGAAPQEAVMVGDSLGKDVAGALAAGLGAVWLNRAGAARHERPPAGVPEIAGLDELASALAAAA